MDKQTNFKPYIPADRVTPELTVTSVIIGIILAVIFGAANAYLGLRVGMTVSASIPAAVIAMGVIRVIMRKNSILESNIVQTIGSAGESVAAGSIFTLPALFIWAEQGKTTQPGLLEITLIALIGGLLGVFFMIPLRNALIVKEHGNIPYPEGTACAEVLLAGEKGGANASTVFAGMGFAAIFKFIVDGIKAIPSQIDFSVNKLIHGYHGQIGTQIYPALTSVGFICGPRISSYMFAGGMLSWMVLIPLICLFGADATVFGELTVSEILAMPVEDGGGISGIWSTYIKYIGAGALATGGIISLIKSFPLILRTFGDALKGMGKNGANHKVERTSKELNFGIVIAVIVILALAIWLIPAIPVNPLGAVIIVIFGFFFATVSSRMVGIVGSSNNPVSGMAIATIIVSTLLLKITGETGMDGMTAAIAIGSIICIVAAISGDTSQDLKTGYILGATPKKQQIGEVIGVVASALAIGGTLYLLDNAWGFGTPELAAPQAKLMQTITEGVMEGNLPWALVLIGVFIAVVVEIAGLPVLPFAIGIYLPVQLNACIMIGGLVRLFIDKKKCSEEKKMASITNGTLFCSGMIAGEGLMGILLAIPAIIPVGTTAEGKTITALDAIALNLGLPGFVTNIIGILGLVLIIIAMLGFSIFKKEKKQGKQ